MIQNLKKSQIQNHRGLEDFRLCTVLFDATSQMHIYKKKFNRNSIYFNQILVILDSIYF